MCAFECKPTPDPNFLTVLTSTVPYGTASLMNYTTPINAASRQDAHNRSDREQEVLSAVLDLMVEEGDRFSMASVARKASCSKETLYRWFGDRDGLLTATVQWQASKVIMPELDEAGVTSETFFGTLEAFAQSWLDVLTGNISVALNRLAVSHAGNGQSNLGQIVLENGPLAMRRRLLPIFEIGYRKGFLSRKGDGAFRLFFGLVVADMQIRAMLGDDKNSKQSKLNEIAVEAVKNFRLICGDDLKYKNTH